MDVIISKNIFNSNPGNESLASASQGQELLASLNGRIFVQPKLMTRLTAHSYKCCVNINQPCSERCHTPLAGLRVLNNQLVQAWQTREHLHTYRIIALRNFNCKKNSVF